jgi:hypothetical protein
LVTPHFESLRFKPDRFHGNKHILDRLGAFPVQAQQIG